MSQKHYTYILIAICIVSRLPQLLNHNIALDGDEAVCGLMIKHILAGKEFPLYFYGQNYGFTLFESLISLPFCAIGGLNTFTVKLPILLMWTAGVVVFYKALVHINNSKAIIPFVLALMLATTPAWAVWSMKARGGYQTSFLLSSVILYLLFNKKTAEAVLIFFFIGLLSVIIYEAQKLWLIGLIPIILYKIIALKSAKHFIALLLGLSVSVGVFYGVIDHFSAHNHSMNQDMDAAYNNLSRFLNYMFAHFKGKYYLAEIYPENLFTAASAYIYIAIYFLLIIGLIYFVFKRAKDIGFFVVSIVSVITTILVPSAFSQYIEPRYLLPLSGFMLLSLQLLINNVRFKNAYSIAALAITSISIVATLTFWNFPSGKITQSAIDDMILRLKEKNIKHVFTTYAVLNNQITFYSNEEVIARNQWLPGRYPPYTNSVNHAREEGKPHAVVGYPYLYNHNIKFDSTYTSKEYFIGFSPDQADLERAFGFYE